mgnify:CR=1 FL=1
MARSLARYTQLFASTLTRDNVTTGNMEVTNTYELKVLDGYSFSQDVTSQEVGISEAASEAECSALGLARGTLSFNTALNPVDVSFSTYVRPYTNSVDITGSANSYADCVERVLWGSAMGSAASYTAVTTTGAAPEQVITAQDGTSISFGLAKSNVNELLPLTLCFVLENATYVVEQFQVGSAEVDFSIDGIATINWSGTGSRVNQDDRIHDILRTNGTAVSGTDYTPVPATTTTTFLRNKLSTLELSNNEVYGFDPTSTPDATDGVGSVTNGVITLDGTISVSPAYVGGIVLNTTRNEWAFIPEHNTTTITVPDSQAKYVDVWAGTDNLSIWAAAQDDVDAVDDVVPVTDGVITLGGTIADTPAYVGGKVVNLHTGEWATILSHNTTTVTVVSADSALVNGWTANDVLAFYTTTQESGAIYCVPITGGSLTLENNITYLTPEELAIVNLPLAGFTGSRSTSGSFTAYLNTGAQGTGGLLQDQLNKIETSVSNNYALKFHMGGDSTTNPRVDFIIPHAQIGIPTTNVEDIITTEISFAGKPWDTINNVGSFEDTNELSITYYD